MHAIVSRSEITANHEFAAALAARRRERATAAALETRKLALTALRQRGMPIWAREIVEQVSHRTGVHVIDIAGRERFRKMVAARNEAIYRVKERKPTLSCVLIGKWFGRDHTSILHAIACHQQRYNAPRLVGYDLDRVRNRNVQTSATIRQSAKSPA